LIREVPRVREGLPRVERSPLALGELASRGYAIGVAGSGILRQLAKP
jgi:hypothetical protein